MSTQPVIVRGALHRTLIFPSTAEANAYCQEHSQPHGARDYAILLDVWVFTKGLSSATLFCRWYDGKQYNYQTAFYFEAVPQRLLHTVNWYPEPPEKPTAAQLAYAVKRLTEGEPPPTVKKSERMARLDARRMAMATQALFAHRARRERFPLSKVRAKKTPEETTDVDVQADD